MSPILDARGLEKRFPGGVRAVAGVNLTLRRGEVVGLVGESGSGKTTLGKLLLHIVPPDSGSVHFDGVPLAEQSTEDLRTLRRRFQMIYQSSSAALNPGMTVREHLMETLALHRPEVGDAAPAVLTETLKRFRLEGKADRKPAELSGGERRRVGVARCLLPDPDLVVADEPTAGLDASVKADVLRTMLDNRRPDQSWIFISHELDVVRYVSDRVLVMYRGHVVEEMPARQLDPAAPPGRSHPYTERLLSTALGVDREAIDPANRPDATSGCRYRGACHAVAPGHDVWTRCAGTHPPATEVAPGHRIACHLRAPAEDLR